MTLRSRSWLVIFFPILVFCGNKRETNSTVDSHDTTNALLSNYERAVLLDGAWVVEYIVSPDQSLDELYPKDKPSLLFTSRERNVSGFTGCNNFSGAYILDTNELRFSPRMAVTSKTCRNMAGEDLFLETLKQVNFYSFTDQHQTLNLITGDRVVMRLSRP